MEFEEKIENINKPYWRTCCFSSGTHIVTSRLPNLPWLYIYGPNCSGAEESFDDIRYKMCEEISSYLNNEIKRPDWLYDMERVSETRIIGVDGSSIFATGPKHDVDPPKCVWRDRDDEVSKNARAKLINQLFITRK
jgi:hypothetical protein